MNYADLSDSLGLWPRMQHNLAYPADTKGGKKNQLDTDKLDPYN